MSNLKEELAQFDPKSKKYKSIEDNFAALAKSFLYGGYISVRDCDELERYQIYIRTVEFYCHHEGDDKNLPKDPIVYHRNGRYVEGEVPYFPLMSFHAHASGYDITFENPTLKLRSSALIRAYEVYDKAQNAFLHYDRDKKKFVSCNDSKDRVNKQSTYLYNFLNGFIGSSVIWKDKDLSVAVQNGIESKVRQNVYQYEYDESINDWKKKEAGNGKLIKDVRKWSFTRLDEIESRKD